MTSLPSRNNNVDYRRVQELVNSIKKLKGCYCLEYERYELKAQEAWKEMHKFEAQL